MTTGPWLDRLTDTRADTPTAPLIPGQWRYVGDGPLHFASPDDLLLTDDEGHVPLPALPFTVPQAALPDADAAAHLHTLSDHLLDPVEASALHTLLDTSPLIDHGAIDLQPTPLDHALRTGLGALEHACRTPRTLLTTDAMRVLTARCKRPSPQAALTLAQHPEDWAARTITGVRPLRVLANVREEDLDLYENRIVASLIDRLDRTLAARTLALRRVLDLLQRRADYQDVATGAPNYRRTLRLLALWGAAGETPGLLDRVQQTLARLTLLRQRLRALMDTPLYRHLRGRTGPMHLRMTNIFSHDPIYRGVAALWLAQQADQQGVTATPEDRWQRAQTLAAAFQRFSLLVILRALHTLGLSPETPRAATPHTWSFAGPFGPVHLTTPPHGAWLLVTPHDQSLRIASFPVALEAIPAAAAWRASLTATLPTLILHLPAPQTNLPTPSGLRTFTPSFGHAVPDAIVIAPWDLESVERVARALRWHLWAPALSQTPPRLTHALTPRLRNALPELDDLLTEDWLVATPNGPLHRALDRLHNEAATTISNTEHRIATCKPRDTALKHLRHTLAGHQRDLDAINRLGHALETATEHLNAVLRCPACHHTNSASARVLDPGFCRCLCASCGATWGVEPCNGCDTPIPWLRPTSHAPPDSADLDATWGCDALALHNPDGTWRCPTCAPHTVTS